MSANRGNFDTFRKIDINHTKKKKHESHKNVQTEFKYVQF